MRQVITPETSAVMRTLMEGVVTEGTGKNGAVPATVSAERPAQAKSWTAKTPPPVLRALPQLPRLTDPKIAVLICLDEPHSWTTSGGALAGPVAAAVLEQALPHLGIAPSFTAEEQETLFAVVPDVTGWRTGGGQAGAGRRRF